MPLVQTRGAASAQGFGEFAQATVANYIEEVFSTYLWAGNSSSQSINIGFDLTTKTAMTWFKDRTNADGAGIVNTVQGNTKRLVSYATDAASNASSYFEFTSTGYNLPSATINTTGSNYVGWTFREQPKFFDVVTYTGNATSGRQIAHSLGSAPGMIIVKRTDATRNWVCYHQALGNGSMMILNSTASVDNASALWNNTTPTSTYFTVNNDLDVNGSGATYVAYLFAHDAGGFGLTGTDNVISCGSFTASSGSATVTLGYEPAWVLIKQTNGADNWYITDSMREFLAPPLSATQVTLRANTSAAEVADGLSALAVTSTGFNAVNVATTGQYIYIAIRRGPMKVPTLGTSVFKPMTTTGDGNSVRSFTGVGFPPDLVFPIMRASPGNHYLGDRLRGSPKLETTSTAAEGSGYVKSYDQDGWTTQSDSFGNSFNFAFIDYLFRRAPGFFDEVCYTGTGVAGLTVAHNLTVVPELMIVKGRSIAEEWNVYFGNNTNYLKLNRNDVPQTSTTRWNDTSPTSSVFSLGTSNWVNGSGATYVAYLFATLAGVSKVFSYTGNGSSQTINCGFTGGSRFVMIKRTDAIGDWYVWDSARGIVAGNDPHLSLNTTAAEVTTDDSVDTDNTGFIVNQVAATNVNVSSATYIGLAIA